MRMQGIALLAGASAILTLGACGGSGNCPPAYTTVLQPECTYPNGTQPQMIYPIPHSSGVPDDFNLQGIVVADTSAANYNTPKGAYLAEISTQPTALEASDSPGPLLDGFQPIAAAQIPTPAASPSIPNPVYEVSQTNMNVAPFLGTILPQTHYYIYLQYWSLPFNPNAIGCYNVGPIGDFTTR